MNKSIWLSNKNIKKYDSLKESKYADVCIIGGGLTGITTAYYLSKKNKKVIVLEKNYLGNHTSGCTTGKITSQHGLFYTYLINSLGKEQAKKYLDANEQAITNIENIIKKENIDCDFEKQNSYIFTQKKEEIEKIQNEVLALKSLNFKAEFLKKLNIPIKTNNKITTNEMININKPILGAIKFYNQAQFNSYKYILSLAEKVEQNGGLIYENSEVLKIQKKNNQYIIKTNNSSITAEYVVISSHYPIINFPGFYFIKMYQETSYLIAIETNKKVFEGMYLSSEEPYISLRTALYNGRRIVIIGGMQHKTGAKINLKNCYKNLEKVARDLYPDCKILFRWSAQDCISLDKIPYIGDFSYLMPNVFVATGYKKWGITTSNIAANILTDKILGRKNEYADMFNSKRLKPIKNYKELSNMIKETCFSLVLNKLKKEKKYINDLQPEEGKIVEIDGKKIGLYKDKNNHIYAVKPYCSHLGCELSWNNLEKTWDCPCHGSKFNYNGKNLYEPALKDLEKYKFKNK